LKFLIKLLLFILAAILAGLLVTRPVIAEAPQSNSSITNPPYGPTYQLGTRPDDRPKISSNKSMSSGRHTVSAENYEGQTYSKEEVQQLIRDYSVQYGISSDLPLRVANCESGYNQFSKNRYSTASGVFQYTHSTWIHTESGLLGLSPFDARANVEMAIKSIASGGVSNWAASKNCWN
jgi:hypothetical protein